MALMYSKGMPLGTQAPDFDLIATDGLKYSLANFSSASVLVIVFSCNHCPYVQATEDRFIELQKQYTKDRVQFVFINANDADKYKDDSFPNMQARAALKQYPFPYLWDSTQVVAKAYDAACTPDIFVFDTARKLCYNGRLDDSWQNSSKVTSCDLARAIDAVLAHQKIQFKVIPSMGCSIKWKE